MKYDVVIIGSGLGGLQCAYILAKKGLQVCVLEKNAQLGGCLQTFRRNGTLFDTGFHYVGGLADGQPLNRIFSYFGLLDLPWYPLDEAAFDEVSLGDESYFFANGYDRFAETLASQFPAERAALKRYAEFLRQVGENIIYSFEPRKAQEVYGQSLFARSAYEFLCETIDNPKLRQVLSGTSLKMELNPQTLPLYVFAQINSSFIQSAWRLRGGGQQIAERLAEQIRQMGGTVRKHAEVVRLDEDSAGLTAAILTDGERVEGKRFISDVHPAATMQLLAESKFLRRLYRNRVETIPNTFGMFTVNCALKENVVPYRNRNQYLYEIQDLWSLYDYRPKSRVQAVLASYQVPEKGKFTRNIDLLTPMYWPEVQAWNHSKIMQRGEAYEAMKQQKAEDCIRLASKKIPELRDGIDKIYTSTPLSYSDYTATAQGSAYGIRKDYNNLMCTLLTPRTPVPNLLLTGQNLNMHGILGVSMTSFLTCSEWIGIVNPFL